MKKFGKRLAEYLANVQRALRSKTVLSALAGLAVHYSVRRGWIPDALFTNTLEAASYVLCVVFRYTATADLKIKTQPDTETVSS